MDIATIYGAWRVYKYVSTAYSTYETVVAVYGTACTVAATTGAVVGYIAPSLSGGGDGGVQPTGCIIIEKEGEWEVVEML